jgi:hypothetical protein
MIVSPGSQTAIMAAALAGEPEYGWTLTCGTANNCLAKEMAAVSISSTILLPW